MKRKISTITAAILIFAAMTINISAESWYFKRNGGNQPLLDASQKITEKYNCRYVDKEHGDGCDEKVIYITFDAGYENGNVAKILDVLKEEKVQASFFILENLIMRSTDVVKRMADEGHLVCNHTAKHRNMSGATKEEFARELASLESIYREYTGREMAKIYRPPEGAYSEQNLIDAGELGYMTVFWSFAYADWDNGKQPDADAAVKKIIDNTHNGEIILLHPTSNTNAAIMKTLIDKWREAGYEFKTLESLR